MRQLKITKQITNRDTASLEKYLHEISREGLITAEEEVELAKKIKAGDIAALDKMVRSNLRLPGSKSRTTTFSPRRSNSMETWNPVRPKPQTIT